MVSCVLPTAIPPVPFSGDSISTILLLAGMALLTLILLRRWARYFGKTRKTNGSPRNHRRRGGSGRPSSIPLSDAPPEVSRWHVEMHEIMRDMKAELDSKMVALKELTRQADERTAALRSAIERAERLGIGVKHPLERIESLAGGEVLPQAPPPETRELAGDRRARQRIVSLAATGATARDIAETTGVPLGDVELVLSLEGAT